MNEVFTKAEFLDVIVCALVAYPLVWLAAGRAWPAMPAFGAPCPVTGFTCGLLRRSQGRVSRLLLIVPVGWALLTTVVAAAFGLHEDWGLPIAAVATAIWVRPRRRARRTQGDEVQGCGPIWRHARNR